MKWEKMTISLIIPVHNAEDQLVECLNSVFDSTRVPDEVIIVDDASTAKRVKLFPHDNIKWINLEGNPKGPAFARNRGADAAAHDILVFIDSDVVLHKTTLAQIERVLEENSQVTALFGSYDDAPREPNFGSQFKNLFHHYVHQHGQKEAFTFWSGCGAIRRLAFQEMGGFNESYTRPSVEDIEFGSRLRQSGHTIWLCPEIQVTHLKSWTLSKIVYVDIFCRAVPWSRLIIRSGPIPTDLNLKKGQQVSAVLVWLLPVSVVLSFFESVAVLGVTLPILGLCILNRHLYQFFLKKRGSTFTLKAVFMHLFYLAYSSLTFGIISVLETIKMKLKN